MIGNHQIGVLLSNCPTIVAFVGKEEVYHKGSESKGKSMDTKFSDFRRHHSSKVHQYYRQSCRVNGLWGGPTMNSDGPIKCYSFPGVPSV